MSRALMLALCLVAGSASATKFRRPFASSSYKLGNGFDHNFSAAGCKDYACGTKCYNTHSGSDFPMPTGTDVLAGADGTVSATSNGCPSVGFYGSTCGGKCGNYAQLTHADGSKTIYCHMKNGSIAVKNGQKVKCGQKLGDSATSGSSTGPHLHFGWRPGSSSQDPYKGNCSSGNAWVSQGTYSGLPGTTCEVSCACTKGKKETQACGNCGSRSRTCGSNCQWGAWSACGGQGVCKAGTKDSDACGNCGTKSRTCTSKCAWGAWSSCAGQGACTAGKKETQKCGKCGSQTRTCSNTCGWGKWSACSGEGVCTAGQKESGACGLCGTHARICGSDCQWDPFSACSGEGECKAGAVESTKCCDCGQKSRTCDAKCHWSAYSACDGPDPVPAPSCATGQAGACSLGVQECQQGCLTCTATTTPAAEVCDDLDNDCDGVTDEDAPPLATLSAAYAATVESLVAPDALIPGERGSLTVVFRNVGSATWSSESTRLVATSVDKPAALYDPDSWMDSATVAQAPIDVAAGKTVAFDTFVRMPADGSDAATHFGLVVGDTPIRCPSLGFDVDPKALPAPVKPEPAATADATGPPVGPGVGAELAATEGKAEATQAEAPGVGPKSDAGSGSVKADVVMWSKPDAGGVSGRASEGCAPGARAPRFGVVGVVLALLGVLILRRRRHSA